MLVGAGCGLFNGLAVTLLGMNPFIVTRAAMAMARGLAFILLRVKEGPALRLKRRREPAWVRDRFRAALLGAP